MRKFIICLLILFICHILNAQPVMFIRGDANNDGIRDQSDAIFILEYLYEGGDAPSCADAADVDNSGEIDQTDSIVLLYHVNYNDPPTLPDPFDQCGNDIGQDPELLLCGSHICGVKFIRGDLNEDGDVDNDDYIKLNSLLNQQTTVNCLESADVNDDGSINGSDLAYLSQYLFMGGQEPPEPFNVCNFDFEFYPVNAIDCDSHDFCN